jgi:hypothetical protein
MNKPVRIIEGQVWTFVRLDGRRVDYRLDWVEDQEGGNPASIVKLVKRCQRRRWVGHEVLDAPRHSRPARLVRLRPDQAGGRGMSNSFYAGPSDLSDRHAALDAFDALRLKDDGLASWAHATVIDPETSRDLGALANWATDVCDYPIS